MSKYTNLNSIGQEDPIERYIDPMEYVFWKGKGKKLAYVLNSSAALAPFALIWLLVDGGMIFSFVGASTMGSGLPSEVLMFIIPFFLVHLMPVWIWIGMMVKGAKNWEKSSYAITDKQIVIKDRKTGMNVHCYKYDVIRAVKVHRGFMDKILGTSDLQFYLIDGSHVDILDIKGVDTIYPRVKQRIEETPCVRELHPHSVAGDASSHECKDYAPDYNPYE